MSEAEPASSIGGPPLTVDYKLSLADFETYRVQAQRRRNVRDGSSDEVVLAMFAIGVLAILAGLIAFAIGGVDDIRNPTVPLACALTYYATRNFEVWIVTRRRLRAWRQALAPLLEDHYTMVIDAGGLDISSPQYRQWSSWRRVQETTSREGLIVFWVHDAEGLILPRRAVSDEEASRIFAFARAARAVKV